MNEAPVLILAYNRADKVAGLIDSLRPLRPSRVLVGVDGPSLNKPKDVEKVAEVHKVLESINWTNDVQILERENNLGLKRAVIDSVDWAISTYGKAIVIEEDVVVGSQFLDFMNQMLKMYAKEDSIGHVSGYNVVPRKLVSTDGVRLTRYPESIAWATWNRAWSNFDEELTWGANCSIDELSRVVGSRLGALKWKLNFLDAKNDRISTWAYRWIASIWSQDQYVISPNVNLVNYSGFDSGSHALTAAPWSELPIGQLDIGSLENANEVEFDEFAEKWIKRTVFKESLAGLTKGLLVSAIRSVSRERH
jgi:hypothetical protein